MVNINLHVFGIKKIIVNFYYKIVKYSKVLQKNAVNNIKDTNTIGGIMAIQDSFNLSRALNSQAFAYKCWYNYQYGNNTMGISSKDMNEIRQTWSGELANWKANALDDENKYVIEDDDFTRAYKNGKETVQDATGYEGGGKGKMIVRGSVDILSGAAGVAAAETAVGNKIANKVADKAVNAVTGKAANELVSKAAEKAATKATEKVAGKAAEKAADVVAEEIAKGATKEVAEKAGEEAAKKVTEEAAEKASEKITSAGKNVGWIITAPLALAQGTAYMANKPNKEQKEACDVMLNETMPEALANTEDAQVQMQTMGEEIVELSDEAVLIKEETNEDLEIQKTNFDAYRDSYEELTSRVASGEKLTEDEKDLLKAIVPEMQNSATEMEDATLETTTVVGEIYDEMGTYQSDFDDAAEVAAEVEGITDYAEGFDSTAQTMCTIEALGQGLNAYSGGKAAVAAGKFAASGGIFTAWAWGFAAAGAAGAAMSGVGAIEQSKWAGEIGNEIASRELTQDVNTGTLDVYDESIQDYEGAMDEVKIEIEVPEDIDAPEELPVIPENNDEEKDKNKKTQNSTTGNFGAITQTTDIYANGLKKKNTEQ